jgi:hypothetical protein
MKCIQYFSVVLLLAGTVGSGCKNDDNPVTSQLSEAAYEDAAYTIAGAVGDDNGGATQSVGDLLTFQATGSLTMVTPTADGGIETVTSDTGTYDPATGWWTVTINRSKSNMRVTMSISRTYQFRFWKNDSVFQQFYIVNSDTAKKMELNIVSGAGYFKNKIVTHHLTQLQGGWLASDINKDTVTITLTKNYIRKGIDSVVTMRASRIFDHTLTLTYVNLTTARYKPSQTKPFLEWRENLANAISGTIKGNITATATIIRGDDDKVRTINKDFEITVGGGEGMISMDGKKFRGDMKYGDRP